jgi:DNA processing protein
MNDAQRLAWLRLCRTENIGPITFKKLIARYGTPSAALDALPELAARRGKRGYKAYAISAAEQELEKIKKAKAEMLCLGDALYPPLLAKIDDAPPVITFRGRSDLLLQPGIAIVGARNASLPGRRMAEILAKELCLRQSESGEQRERSLSHTPSAPPRSGFSIISGMARGIDTAAHQSALTANGGTIAVLAGGVDVVYPQENQKLYDDIAERGVIVAENPPGYPPTNRDFPRRNRIISGLSLATIIVEAAVKSGSLITAEYALQQGREVMAVPGSPMDPRAGGTNKLIKDGAQLIENAEDVISCLLYTSPSPRDH